MRKVTKYVNIMQYNDASGNGNNNNNGSDVNIINNNDK